VKELWGERLLALSVRLHGIEVGRPVDLLLDRGVSRVVGLDLVCGDRAHRFLPLPTAVVEDDALAIHSPLVLLEEDERRFYRTRTFALSAVRDRPVLRNGRPVGKLRDIVFAPDGKLLAVVVEPNERIPFDGTLEFAPQRRTAA
jgi:hypothetical protein